MLRKHLTQLQILDYLEGKLSPQQIAWLEEHLANGCTPCSEKVAWWRNVLQQVHASGELTAASAPQNALIRAKNIMHESKTALQALMQLRQARLVFDSRSALLAAGARGSAHAIQQTYQLDQYTIEIGMERQRSGNWSVMGVLLAGGRAASEPLTRAELFLPNGYGLQMSSSQMEFYADSVPRGSYIMLLQHDGNQVQIAPLQVGEEL